MKAHGQHKVRRTVSLGEPAKIRACRSPCREAAKRTSPSCGGSSDSSAHSPTANSKVRSTVNVGPPTAKAQARALDAARPPVLGTSVGRLSSPVGRTDVHPRSDRWRDLLEKRRDSYEEWTRVRGRSPPLRWVHVGYMLGGTAWDEAVQHTTPTSALAEQTGLVGTQRDRLGSDRIELSALAVWRSDVRERPCLGACRTSSSSPDYGASDAGT